MSSGYAEEMIKIESERILLQIKDGKIYGVSVDLYNLRQVVVAAYYAGWMQSQNASLKALDNAFENLK